MCEMESYTYDFTYMFTIIYFRTIYFVTTEAYLSPFLITLDESAISSPPTAKLRTIIDGKELVVSQIPLSSTITEKTRYLSKEVITQLREQIRTMIQVAHKNHEDSFMFKVSGIFCWRPVASLLQIVLREHKGVFRTITFQCPNDEVKNMYQEIFGAVCD
jgi:hypothetical protein